MAVLDWLFQYVLAKPKTRQGIDGSPMNNFMPVIDSEVLPHEKLYFQSYTWEKYLILIGQEQCNYFVILCKKV